MSSVEIFFPAGGEDDDLDGLVAELEAAGVETTCRVRPIRRSSDQAILVVVATTTLQPFLAAFFQQFSPAAHKVLRRFVARLAHGHAATAVERTVVMEASGTGAQFVFTPGLPATAYQQAIAHDPGEHPGRWVWHDTSSRWLRFEDAGG